MAELDLILYITEILLGVNAVCAINH